MDYFQNRDGQVYCEGVGLDRLAHQCGTPLYVYSRATLARHCQELVKSFAGYPTLACYAVKANSNLSVLREIFSHGLGADLVSIGELERSLAAGVAPDRIVFSGVGKRDEEIERALQVGILSFNVESGYELQAIARIAKRLGKVAPVTLRVNPNVDAKTIEKINTGLYTTKFGLPEAEVMQLAAGMRGDASLSLVGVGCHIGSQILDLEPMAAAARRMVAIAGQMQQAGAKLKYLNMGGGLGIRYANESPPVLADYAKTLVSAIKPTGLDLIIEPGRVLVGNVGVLLSRVVGVKSTPAKHFVVLDAAMNDLIRPSLYDAYHAIEPVQSVPAGRREALVDFVGPVCETGDFLGKDRRVPLPEAGELYFIRGAGAYAASMASQYNTRPRAAEVMVDGERYRIVKPRESLAALLAEERAALPPP